MVGAHVNQKIEHVPEKFFSYVSLGCTNLELEIHFYRSVFLLPEPHKMNKFWASWQLPDYRLALCEYHVLNQEMGLPGVPQRPEKYYPHTVFSQNVTFAEQVDAMILRALQGGATVTRFGAWADWGGYRGYFCSPSGHFWEICFNPQEQTATV